MLLVCTLVLSVLAAPVLPYRAGKDAPSIVLDRPTPPPESTVIRADDDYSATWAAWYLETHPDKESEKKWNWVRKAVRLIRT